LVLGCFVGLSVTESSPALAGDNTTSASSYTPFAEGSTVTHRAEIDSCYGQVYIYVGG
jgi:hypothetical protein